MMKLPVIINVLRISLPYLLSALIKTHEKIKDNYGIYSTMNYYVRSNEGLTVCMVMELRISAAICD